MAQSLRERVSLVIANSADTLLPPSADQTLQSLLECRLHDIAGVIGEVSQEFGIVTAHRHLAQRHHTELNRRHLTLSASAESALELDKEDVARAAIAEQLELETQIPAMRDALQELVKCEKQLFDYLDTLLGRQRELELQLHNLTEGTKNRRSAPGSPDISGAANAPYLARANAGRFFKHAFQQQTTCLDGTLSNAGLLPACYQGLDQFAQERKIEERLIQMKERKT